MTNNLWAALLDEQVTKLRAAYAAVNARERGMILSHLERVVAGCTAYIISDGARGRNSTIKYLRSIASESERETVTRLLETVTAGQINPLLEKYTISELAQKVGLKPSTFRGVIYHMRQNDGHEGFAKARLVHWMYQNNYLQ